MGKELAILTISFVTLIVAGYAAYTVSGMGNAGAPTAAAAVNDYTEEFESIQSKLNQVTLKLEQLESDTITELQQIKSDLNEFKKLQTETIKSATSQFRIVLDNAIYTNGDKITILATGVLPQKVVTIELQSISGEVISKNLAYSDSQGTLNYSLMIPNYIGMGSYKVKATYNGNEAEALITISEDPITESIVATSTSSGFQVSLDKESYSPGDIIRITGVGNPGESLALETTDSSGEKTSAHSNVSSDGTYTMIYILDSNAKKGNWQMVLTHGSNQETIPINIQ